MVAEQSLVADADGFRISAGRQVIIGRRVILATGGAGKVYRFTTNPEIATRLYLSLNTIKASPGQRTIDLLWNVPFPAAKLGVKLITREVHDPETLNDAVLNIPVEADAVFILPDSLIGTRLPDI